METSKQHKARVAAVQLILSYIVRTEQQRRSTYDHRVRVNYTLASYRDKVTGEEYRVAFEAKNAEPNVPTSGPLTVINNQRKQW